MYENLKKPVSTVSTISLNYLITILNKGIFHSKPTSYSACCMAGRMAIHAMEAKGFHSKLQSMKVGILLGDGINGERIEEGIEKNI